LILAYICLAPNTSFAFAHISFFKIIICSSTLLPFDFEKKFEKKEFQIRGDYFNLMKDIFEA